MKMEIHWVPAHIGIKGNEMADVAAKKATSWRQKKNRRGKRGKLRHKSDGEASPSSQKRKEDGANKEGSTTVDHPMEDERD